MASYGPITFFVVAEESDNTLTRPEWNRGDDALISRTRIPYSDKSYAQRTGLSNPLLVLKCEIFSDADYQTFRAMRGDMVPRTLTNPFGTGENYSGVLLQKITDAKRVTFQEDWMFTAEFEQVV